MYGLYLVNEYRVIATLGKSQIVVDSDLELARFIGKSLDYLFKFYPKTKLIDLTQFNCLELL